jgi:hypothetical protein
LPSNADAAGVPPFSVDEAVAGLPCATLAVPHVPGPVDVSPNTWNSHSDTPYAVVFAVALTRTYRPVPVTVRLWLPPVPVVVL